MNFTEKDVLAVQANAFERARSLVLLLLSRKPVVTAFDVQAIGNPYDGRNGFDQGAPMEWERAAARTHRKGQAVDPLQCAYGHGLLGPCVLVAGHEGAHMSAMEWEQANPNGVVK